jgi:predicted Zn-dependent peptidase
MPFHTTRLPSGLEIVGETIPTARSAAVGFFVRTGARDETPDESGVSHFLEHMLFKGTPRRTALEVNLDFDRIGASYNAYTSEESTVYYAAVLPEYLASAIDILADILRPSLRVEDFDTEKLVILEEIGMYDDMPAFAASDIARKTYYAAHPLGNTILGTTASVTALTQPQMMDYFHRRYGPANIVVAVAGQLDWDTVVGIITEKCGHWSGPPAPRQHLHNSPGVGGIHLTAKAGVNQEHAQVMSPGPSAEDPLRYAAAMLTTAIGDVSGSRLYWALVDSGLAESASCGCDLNQASGVIQTNFSCEPEQAAENLQTVQRILNDVQRDGITDDELRQAQSKIASRLVRSAERPKGRMSAVAGNWITNREYNDIDTELARCAAVTQQHIRAVLDQFPLTQNTALLFGPLEQLGGATSAA